MPTKWTDAEIERQLRLLTNYGVRYNCDNNQALYGAVKRRYSKWIIALKEVLGIDYGQYVDSTAGDKKSREIELFKKELFALRSTKSSYVSKHYISTYNKARKLFGSLEQALKQCGIEYRDHTFKWSKEKILNRIRRMKKKTDLKRRNPSLYYAAFRMFGSWKNAIQMAGFNYEEERYKWTKTKIVDQILRLKKNALGSSVAGKTQLRLFRAAIAVFGSWRSAIESAGYNYDEILHKNSSEDLLYGILRSIFRCAVKRQYSPKWLKFKSQMHLDFYVPKYNIAIEYQGEQHYMPVCFGGVSIKVAEEQFEQNKLRDEAKRQLLEKHEVRLIEIKYDQDLTKQNIASLIELHGGSKCQ